MGTVICPFATREFERIKENHSTLASTGCTRDFCQSGRIIHTDEPRVGENRPISSVEHDAEGFLKELLRDGFFASEAAYQERLQHALYEIRGGAVEGIIRETKETGLVGGNWTQTPEEIEFGLRRAWRNARKCIMRSHCDDLKLCDLRNVTSSNKMAVELMKALSKAYNDGNILPTAFVFPPRTPNNRGPMIWNDQLLTFAGYELEDGSILGDPKNVQFTKDVIELGWVPPKNKTRFDLLPVVVMAEGDLPVIVELPSHLRKLIEIRHPEYPGLGELDLKWAAFPALSRLGFDIGGVQYTATPFIGWFMEAEIGTRNLADFFRYNVLPDVVKALHLADDVLVDVDSFDDLPEYEKLALLSRAQTELNYAVQHSYIREKITMSDSLTASIKFSRYDDEFQKKHGFRLPSDPFWVAPPQGSIIPLWHRGAAPNYQPKPMICRHVQDPAKAWKREKSSWPVGSTASTTFIDTAPNHSAGSSEATLTPQIEEVSVMKKLEPSPAPNVLPASIAKKAEPSPPPEDLVPKEPETPAKPPPTDDDLTAVDLKVSPSDKPTSPPIRAYPIIKRLPSQNSPSHTPSHTPALVQDVFFTRPDPQSIPPVTPPPITKPSATLNGSNNSKPNTPPRVKSPVIPTTPGISAPKPVPSTPSFSLGLEETSTPPRVLSAKKSSDVLNGRNNSIWSEPRVKSPAAPTSSQKADPFNTSSYSLPSWIPRVNSTPTSPPALNGNESSEKTDVFNTSSYSLPSWTPQVDSTPTSPPALTGKESSEKADIFNTSSYSLPSWTPGVKSTSATSSALNGNESSNTSSYSLPSWTPGVISTSKSPTALNGNEPSKKADTSNISSYSLPSWTPQVNSIPIISPARNGNVSSVFKQPGVQDKLPFTRSANTVNGVVPKKPETQSILPVAPAVQRTSTSQVAAPKNLNGGAPVTKPQSTPVNGRATPVSNPATQKPATKPSPEVPTPSRHLNGSVSALQPQTTPVNGRSPPTVSSPATQKPLTKAVPEVPAPKPTPKPTPKVEPPKKAELVTRQAPKEAPVERRSSDKGTPASVAIYYTSAGTIAEKLATKLRDKMKALAKTSPHISLDADVHPLDDLEASEMTADKVFLFVVSTTGTGEIPANGTDFSEMCDEIIKTGNFEGSKGFRFAIFGNGDTRYTTTFNSAAIKIQDQLRQVGGDSLIGSFYEADTAVQSPPWSALNKYWAQVQEKIS